MLKLRSFNNRAPIRGRKIQKQVAKHTNCNKDYLEKSRKRDNFGKHYLCNITKRYKLKT